MPFHKNLFFTHPFCVFYAFKEKVHWMKTQMWLCPETSRWEIWNVDKFKTFGFHNSHNSRLKFSISIFSNLIFHVFKSDERKWPNFLHPQQAGFWFRQVLGDFASSQQDLTKTSRMFLSANKMFLTANKLLGAKSAPLRKAFLQFFICKTFQ